MLAKLAIAALLVTWLIRTGRFEPRALLEVRSILALLGLFFFQSCITLGQSLRWKVLLDARGMGFSLRDAILLGVAGQFAAVWTPAGLGLDGVRIMDGARRFPSRHGDVVKVAALDRVLAVAALLVLAIPGVLWLLRITTISSFAYGAYLLAVLALACVVPRKWRAEAIAFSVSLGVHSANAGAAVCAFWALGKSVSWEGTTLATPLVMMSGIIPLTPLGIGVVDGAAAELYRRAAMLGGAESTMLGRAAWIITALFYGATLLRNKARGTVEKGHTLAGEK